MRHAARRTVRWVCVAAAIAVLSGCTGGSAPADVDQRPGADPPAAGGTPTASASPSTHLVGDGPVLAAEQLPFAAASDRSWTAEQALTYVTDPPGLPGSPVMSYSNSNFLLLGLLIERVTGLSYAAAVRRDLLPGLGERIVVGWAPRSWNNIGVPPAA